MKVLVNEIQDAGNYSVYFDGGNTPSGVYFYRLQTENFSDIKKMLLIVSKSLVFISGPNSYVGAFCIFDSC